MPFSSLGLDPALLKTLTRHNYTRPYPIQKQAIPAILKKKDVLGIAQTGSGKTASYVLPLLMNFKGKQIIRNRRVNTLVLVPTRELALQVMDVFKEFAIAIPEQIKILAVYGGVAINPQMKAMQGVNILVATPGRLIELVDSNAVELSTIDTLVLDEADKMLNMGFKDQMNRIFSLLPKKRQNLLFSATLSKDLDSINQILLNDPLVINIQPKEENLELIDQVAYAVSEEKKGPLLRYLIKHNKLKQVLVFTSSVAKADSVAFKLCKNGIQATTIHGKKGQNARIENLRKFKTGKLRVLVATDLISRGIDIEFLPYVINYELPRSPKDYIHRIGRTGRAESPGEAISLVSPEEEHHFKIIQKKIKKQIPLLDIDKINLQGF